MDQRLQPRRPLLRVALAGGRATWHVAVRWAVIGCAALAALLMATERHRVCDAWGSCDASDWGEPHTLASDVGALPFVMLALVVALQLAGYRRGLLGGVLSALSAALAAVVALGVAALAHFLSHVDGGGGAVLLTFLTFGLAVAQLVLEPILFVGMRRALERDDPRFPRAAVVAR
ncbi:MAG: hypothetical protein JNK64_26520 [Myxococcales bacterium]|nr:hypothetical protein [Myxococcales bacterium]